MRRLLAFLGLLALLAACASPPPDAQRADPILYTHSPKGGATSVIIAIPGALTSTKVFEPLEAYKSPTRALAYYRLPGYDGHPAEAPLSIGRAAGQLATFVRDGNFDTVYFVGHSTGAAIAIETAKALATVRPEVRVHVAGISTALPAPQPVLSGVRSVGGTLAAIVRARSLHPRTVWLEQYRRVSYGPDASHHAEIIAKANALVRERGEQIELPKRGLGVKHFNAIIGWTNTQPERLKNVDIAFWHGAVDPVFRAAAVERFAAGLPQAEVKVLPHHGHVILLTYPEIWSEMASRWGL